MRLGGQSPVQCTGLCPPSLIHSVKPEGVPGGELMGVYFLKNLLFLRVSLLELNALTLYCLVLGSAWTTTLPWSQRFGLLPSWFCSMTWSPIEGRQLLGSLLQLVVVELGPPGCQCQLSPVSHLPTGISHVLVGFGFCSW